MDLRRRGRQSAKMHMDGGWHWLLLMHLLVDGVMRSSYVGLVDTVLLICMSN